MTSDVAESTSKAESTTEAKREPREPRALSTEYHKARKQLMLWSAILFIWELVGIDLEKAKQAGGNAGAIIGALKSPQAVPWALVILVFYFAFKLRVEWRQCNQSRRRVSEARQDYYSAFVVAGAACALYFVQTMSRIQLANFLQSSNRLQSFVSGAFTALMLTVGIVTWQEEPRSLFATSFILGSVFFLPLSGLLGHFQIGKIPTMNWTFALTGCAFGLVAAGLIWLAGRRLGRRLRRVGPS